MLEIIKQYMTSLGEMMNEMSPYLLLGFLIAGILQAFVPHHIYADHLGKNNMKSVIKAALFGIPLPLCSCGVIPTSVSLRKEGASKAACTSFLISTPQTGVDSIMATYSMLGLPFAILRPFVALITALFGGFLVNVFDPETSSTPEKESAPAQPASGTSFASRCRQALHYGLVEMLQDVGKWLVIGLLIAALITVLVPEGFFTALADKPWLSMPVVLLLSIPMYLCATGSIPIAVSLMLKGLSPGAALVLLMAGPATNMASILVVSKVFGKKASLLYLLSIVFGAIAFGTCIDLFLPANWFSVQLTPAACCHSGEQFSLFETLCSIFLLGCLINAFLHRKHCCELEHTPEAKAHITLKISGMCCNHCRMNIENRIAQMEGVEKVTVDFQSGMADIEGNITREAVIAEIESMGYSAE